ncbi:tRNA-splicing endonuclease subunit Sen34 [Holothuria leucospilota]|uniref:tRNA-intron lyase n=1 Tax=Holothuria leucospilota TaxID=206669 RepID=A0A9Q0YCK6_HOLLE|nr:tRNA-splicing endonuclease subunit Sen34 [Holothuria leucospilota]
MENEEVINLHLSRGKIFVWNSRDVRLLRETHHIVGSLSGALPRAPRQNIQLGLPLELMSEEAFALISYGVGVLVRLPLPNATEEDITTFQEAREHSFEAQKELYEKQIQAKKESWKESEHQFMSERKRRRLEKKQKKKKGERDDLPEIGSLEKSVGVDDNENEGRSLEECAADTKEVERMSGSSSGMVVEENTSVKMERVTWSTSSESNTDQVQSGSTYTTSDNSKEFPPTQVFGDQAICSSTHQENQSSFQECDIPQKQNQKTEVSVTLGKSSEGLLQSDGYGRESKDRRDYIHKSIGASSKDLDGKDSKTVEEHCKLDKDVDDQKFLKSVEESVTSSTKESEVEMPPSERTRGCGIKSDKDDKREEQILRSDSTSQGVLGNKKSESVSLGVNIEEVKGTSQTKKDVTLSGENEIKKKTGVEKQRSSVHVSDKKSEVCRSHLSSPFEGIIVPTTDRPGPKKRKVTQDGSCLVQLFTEAKDPNYIKVTDWPFPSTDQEKLRAAVFMHFWEQGYYLTSGLKFGGDFLVYKGNPLLFHSTYIAICIPYEESMLTQTLVTYGRLGPIVKKTVVLCSLNENEEVRCVSLQWSGI